MTLGNKWTSLEARSAGLLLKFKRLAMDCRTPGVGFDSGSTSTMGTSLESGTTESIWEPSIPLVDTTSIGAGVGVSVVRQAYILDLWGLLEPGILDVVIVPAEVQSHRN